jgi:3-hydroxymyristoyl/3-hydroxydecanoyl-(acyl carrier protein) dehydratase
MILSLQSTAAATRRSSVYTRSELESMFLPVQQMLQIDRVTEIRDNQIVCEMNMAGHWVFPMHFPGDPIFPGSLLIEAAGQAVAIWSWHKGARGRPRLARVKAEFENPVLTHDQTVRLVGTVRQRRNIYLGSVGLYVRDRKVAQVNPMVVLIPR